MSSWIDVMLFFQSYLPPTPFLPDKLLNQQCVQQTSHVIPHLDVFTLMSSPWCLLQLLVLFLWLVHRISVRQPKIFKSEFNKIGAQVLSLKKGNASITIRFKIHFLWHHLLAYSPDFDIFFTQLQWSAKSALGSEAVVEIVLIEQVCGFTLKI